MEKKEAEVNKVFDAGNGWFGIENEGGILYEDDFDSREEAQAFADAHNKGARSYEEAFAMIYGLEADPSTYPERTQE